MKIQNKQSGNQGVFFINEGGERLAEMTYTLSSDELMIIDHTEVDDALRGNNIGSELVGSAVEYARSKHMKILPECSFARSIFERKKEFSDVLRNG